MKTILAADIGGTNCRFGIFQVENGNFTLDGAVWVPTREIANTEDFLKTLARETGFSASDAGCVVAAMAGPVFGASRGRLTNGALELDFSGCENSRFWIINDFMAQAWAVLSPEGCRAEKICGPDNAPPDGMRAVIGAGTGLGHASLIKVAGFSDRDKNRWEAIPSENGHAAFPFTGAEEIAFSIFLCRRLNIPHATGDDVLTGRGLAILHEYLSGEKMPPHEVGAAALGSETETLVWYSRFYGRMCANWILATVARGGLWIAGGIAARNPYCVRNVHFMNELYGNPRWRDFLEAVPVFLVSNKNSGLWGAAWFGLRALERTDKEAVANSHIRLV